MTEEQSNTVEEWREIPCYEGYYSVSSFGNVRREARPGTTHPTRHLLKPGRDRDGYLRVVLSKQGALKRAKIHALVALTFIGPPADGMTVNHRDGDKANNRPRNLEYCTAVENSRHATRTGLKSKGKKHSQATKLRTPRGERARTAKLTAGQVLEIRAKYATGQHSIHSLSRDYNMSRPSIKAIINRRSWTHI